MPLVEHDGPNQGAGPWSLTYDMMNCPPTGACCAPDGTCTFLFADECLPPNVYMGNGIPCSPNPCSPPLTGGCCVGSDCSIVTQAECDQIGGVHYGDNYPCDPNPCPIVPVQSESWGQIKAAYR